MQRYIIVYDLQLDGGDWRTQPALSIRRCALTRHAAHWIVLRYQRRWEGNREHKVAVRVHRVWLFEDWVAQWE
jgi:hypothetical protein